MTKLLVFLVIFISYESVASITCPNVVAVSNFQISKMQGSWFMYAEHLNDITSHIDCLHSNITKIEDDSLHGYYEGLFKSTGKHVRYHSVTKLIKDSSAGTFQVVEADDEVALNTLIHVLYANYDGCVFMYTCDETRNILWTWTICRNQVPAEAEILEIHKLMDESQIPWTDYDKVNQENCPEMPT